MAFSLYNTDCVPFLENMPDKSVDLLLTDIPYGEVNAAAAENEGTNIRKLNKGGADEVNFDLQEVAGHFCRVTKGSIYVFCGMGQVSVLRQTFVERGLSTRLLIWEKTNPSPMLGQYMWLSSIECCVFGRKSGAVFNTFCESAVLRYPSGSSKEHPTEKPLDLFKKLVYTSSSMGDTVFDPFMGSGTSGVAALMLDRNFIGCELDPDWFKIAERRVKEEATQGKLFMANEW